MFYHQRYLPRVMALAGVSNLKVYIVRAFTQQCLMFMMHYFRHTTDFDLGIKNSVFPIFLRINDA